MTKNAQEYINNLLNKHKTFYLDLSSQCQVSECSHCKKKNWKENSSNLEGEIEDLKEFQNLRGINASNNNFTRLDFLLTIPHKDKVEKVNLFGNKISEVDLARIFTEFPNLKYLNLDRNPLSAKNLENLTSEQLEKLAEGMKSKQIRISINQGTMMADLLEYTQKLIKKGGNTGSAHKLQAILQNGSVKNEQQSNNSKLPWVIGGVAVVSLALVIGYLLGKRKKEKEILD
jgi:uncharacterized protein YjbI with pentapeptide repeats